MMSSAKMGRVILAISDDRHFVKKFRLPIGWSVLQIIPQSLTRSIFEE